MSRRLKYVVDHLVICEDFFEGAEQGIISSDSTIRYSLLLLRSTSKEGRAELLVVGPS